MKSIELLKVKFTLGRGLFEYAALSQYHPLSQGPSGSVLPYPSQYIPGVHGVQSDGSVAPVLLLNVPGGHLNGVVVSLGQ